MKGNGYLLYLEDVSVSFDGFQALKDLTLYIKPGELRCIIGPNGAGKTTLMDIITGRVRADKGTVSFGQDIDLSGLGEAEIARLGIGRKFQRPTVFEAHTVQQNIELALAGPRGFFALLTAKHTADEHHRINELLTQAGLGDQRDRLAGALSHGQKQWLEISMLIAQDPVLLLIDEPVAGMTTREIDQTGQLMQALAATHTVVVIEHDMEFVKTIADQVTVLHQGSVLMEGHYDEVSRDQRVREIYLGT